MLKLIVSNLVNRPTRTVVCVLAVSMGITLVLVSVGLSYGQLNDTAERTRRVGGDLMFRPSDSSALMAISTSTLPVEIGPVLEKIDGVQSATPVLGKFVSEGFHMIFGIDPPSFDAVNGGLRFRSGGMFTEPYQVIVDQLFADSKGLTVGSKISLLDHEFVVTGIYESGIAARVLAPLATMQRLDGAPGKASLFFIRAEEGTDLDALISRIQQQAPGYKIAKTADINEEISDTVPVFHEFIIGVVAVSVLVSFLIILLAMSTTVTERTREIGILRSLGASKSYILGLILREALVICAAGIVLGFILTFVINRAILLAFPMLPIDISTSWRLIVILIGLTGGPLGALYPALKAARQDPVQALSYE